MSQKIKILSYTSDYFDDWYALMKKLFADYPTKDIKKALKRLERDGRYKVYLVEVKNQIIGTATFSIKSDYVEGASQSPTGYLNAIYVKKDFRKQNVAKKLVEKGEKWLLKKGCIEMGSDTWLWNKEAQKFHKNMGFKKKDVLVHYIKKIG
ncbi:MAG: GNAT family N-acetyltransferase [Crocinitomicaceae bacterium]|nr:GNAT family N-acetyltransferase [Crocinitomicaceae bacterium]